MFEKITWNILTLFSCLKTVKFTANIANAERIRQRAKFLNCSTAEKDNRKQNISVTFNGWKNTPYGVLLRHLNYLVLHLFRQIGELKYTLSNLIGPYQWLHMRFQLIPAILYQLSIHWELPNRRTTSNYPTTTKVSFQESCMDFT